MSSSILKQIEQTIGIVCLLTMFIIICANVIMRYVFSSPLYWAEEASNYLFVWIGFLSCANSVAEGRHIRVTALIDRLGERARRAVALAMNCLMLITFGAYIQPSWMALDSLNISTGLQIHERYPYAILPVAMALCFIHAMLRIMRDLQGIASVVQGELS